MGIFRRYLLTTVSVAAFSASALAADLPARMPVKAPAPVVVVSSWAGFYIGVHAGVAWNHAAFADVGDDIGGVNRAPLGVEFWKPRKAGFAGGGQVGYNFQSGSVVYGLEADFSGVSNKASAIIGPPATFAPVNATTQLTWMATVRGRLGVTLSPTLLYITGGLAIAHFKDSWGLASLPAPEYTSNKTRAGWTVGGGVEHMFARNWTAKIEALYADFGDWTVGGPSGNVGLYRSRFEHQVVTVRGGLNYKW
ncbi:MAG: outer membrane beta-barrel protein [Xanthobacteraceae bacterium]|nr:outer membrane beta-barrel protein [Xanthobacteraceae bacterium]